MEFNAKEIKFTRAFICDGKDAIDLVSHRINFVVSSSVVDRDGEIVEAQAVFDAINRKDEFTANPVCLTSHRHRLEGGEVPSIGNWLPETASLKKNRVEMKLQFDTELKLGSQYWIAYKNKTMRAVSIGFITKDYRVEEMNGDKVYIISKLELFEISVCAVGANMQALSKMKELGIFPEIEKQKLVIDSHADYRILDGYKTVIDGVEVTVVTKMELLSISMDKSIEKSIGDRFTAMEKRITETLKDEIEDQFDRLKLLLIDKDNPNGCGGDPLGDPDTPPVEAKQKTGNLLSAIANAIQKTE